ncbi:MAG: phage tail protein [Sphingopyxis macrogoltabida]|uniref:Phage tail protein n=1 Tax=Sphingopyxis macrogoltabida TaxID=33050 RepID=A0A2W5MML5_SPHMC|nr:MAG: phage tail protein [Sphingopyxis macrogoltabida]
MPAEYLTRDGDMVDWIASKHYGATDNRTVEIVLEANPGLADRGEALPAGLTVILPDIERPAKRDGVRLWD